MPTTIAARPHADAGSGFADQDDDVNKPWKPDPVSVQMDFGKIAIPELKGPFAVGDFFSVRAGHGLLVEIDPAFLRIFGEQVIYPRETRTVSRYIMLRRANTEGITGQFEASIALDCHDIAELLLRSALRDRGFGGLDDSPMPSSERPRSNIFCLADDGGGEHWIYLFRIRASWHLMMAQDGMLFQEYGKFFVPHGSLLLPRSFE